jgi:hypothetical protein
MTHGHITTLLLLLLMVSCSRCCCGCLLQICVLLQLPADLTQCQLSLCSCSLASWRHICRGDVAGAHCCGLVLLQLLQARCC